MGNRTFLHLKFRLIPGPSRCGGPAVFFNAAPPRIASISALRPSPPPPVGLGADDGAEAGGGPGGGGPPGPGGGPGGRGGPGGPGRL